MERHVVDRAVARGYEPPRPVPPGRGGPTRLTLDALIVLDAIDRAGSFAGGALRLFRVPSAVSYTIQKLEQDLGIRIFDRSGHRAKLTTAGAQLLHDGRALLRLAEEVERKVKQVDAGWEARLTIAICDIVPRGAFYPLIGEFYAAPGHESTHVHVTTETHATGWERLVSGRTDLVIGVPEPAPDAPSCRMETLGEVELALVVPTGHPLADAPEPLAAHDITRYRVVRQAAWPGGERRTVSDDDLVAVDDYGSQLEAIRHGLGVGYAPAHLVRDDVDAERLIVKELANAPRLRVAIAWRADRPGRGLQWFLDRLGDRDLRARLVPTRG